MSQKFHHDKIFLQLLNVKEDITCDICFWQFEIFFLDVYSNQETS